MLYLCTARFKRPGTAKQNQAQILITILFGLFFCSVGISAEQPDSEKLVFGSCVTENSGSIWSSIKAKNPDLFLLLGDVIYLPEHSFGNEQKIYRLLQMQYRKNSAAGQLINSVKTFAIWDDHDYGPNNGTADFSGAAATRQAYKKFWSKNPESVAELAPALTFKYESNTFSLFVLDGRTFRKRQHEQDSHLFGPKQIAWLKNELRSVPEGKLLVVASGTPFLIESRGKESFSHYPEEQKEFLNLLKSLQRPVVLLSGDRHFAQLLELPDAPIYEAIASPLTALIAKEHKRFVSKYGTRFIAEHNFGLLEIKKQSNKLTARVSILDSGGKELDGLDVLF